jgi:lysophospholipase L1-like esterase
VRRRLAAGGLAFFALCTSLLIAEGVLRALRLAPTEGLTTVTASQFDSIPGHFSPSRSFTDLRIRALPHQVRIDSLGYRGGEVSRAPRVGVPRVLMLGDSFIYGDFVDEGETLPAQLVQMLRQECGTVEVINAGLPGATITDYREVARRGLVLRPDLMVVAFTENDVSDLAAEPLWNQMARNRVAKSSFPFGMVYPVLRQSALWNLAMQVRGKIRASLMRAEHSESGDIPRGIRPDSVLRARYARALTGLAQDAATAGTPLVFLSFPLHFTVYGEWPSEQLHWVDSLARAVGLPVVSTLTILRESGLGRTELFLLPHDGHPSAKGYALAAAELAAVLREHPALQCALPE